MGLHAMTDLCGDLLVKVHHVNNVCSGCALLFVSDRIHMMVVCVVNVHSGQMASGTERRDSRLHQCHCHTCESVCVYSQKCVTSLPA